MTTTEENQPNREKGSCLLLRLCTWPIVGWFFQCIFLAGEPYSDEEEDEEQCLYVKTEDAITFWVNRSQCIPVVNIIVGFFVVLTFVSAWKNAAKSD